ncbi:MAG: glycosyltransferase family 9 protein [Fidelibacterota bacterium]
MKKSLKHIDPKHILIIQTAFIGDVIMSTPLIQAVCDQWPDAEVDILTRPESAILFSKHPRIRRIYTLDKSGYQRKYESFIDRVREIRPNEYDMAFSIQSSLTSSLLMLLCRIKIRVGFYRQKFINVKIYPPKGLHVRQRYLAMIEPFTDKTYSDETHLYLGMEDKQKADDLVAKINKERNILIGFAPGSVRETKKWPASYWTELFILLKDKGYDILFIGSPSERELCATIIHNAGLKAWNAAGELNLLQSAALIHKMDLLICNDSAPLHMGNAVNTPVYAFFGPTVKAFGCYPYREHDKILERDLPCRPCGKHGHDRCPLRHFKCMMEQYPYEIAQLIFERFTHEAKT